MSILTPETVLLITEELQLRDIRALMNTSRSNRKLIKSYEQSIAKARISRLILVPQFQPLDRPVSSSLDVNRTILGPTNFEVVREVERRTAMFCKILNPEKATTFERLLAPMVTDIFRTSLEPGGGDHPCKASCPHHHGPLVPECHSRVAAPFPRPLRGDSAAYGPHKGLRGNHSTRVCA